METGPQNYLNSSSLDDQQSILVATFSEGRLLDAPWSPFASLLAPFGSNWLPVGSRWLLLPFGSLLVSVGSPFLSLGFHFLIFGICWRPFLYFSELTLNISCNIMFLKLFPKNVARISAEVHNLLQPTLPGQERNICRR